MSLQLDARQRAMLEEMGVKLFWPQAPVPSPLSEVPAPAALAVRETTVAAPTTPAPSGPATKAPAPAAPEPPARAPARVHVPGAAPPALDWDGLEQAVASWAAQRHRPAVFGTGDRRADWLCVGDPPVEEEELQGLPFVGDAGRLLDNMLAAVGASRRRGAYLTHIAKCRLPQERAWEDEELAQGLAFLQRQVELLQPRVILAMGRFAVQGLLATGEPLGRLRGRVHDWNGVPVVVTYHPAYLLRNPADKAKAWADLLLAQSLLES